MEQIKKDRKEDSCYVFLLQQYMHKKRKTFKSDQCKIDEILDTQIISNILVSLFHAFRTSLPSPTCKHDAAQETPAFHLLPVTTVKTVSAIA